MSLRRSIGVPVTCLGLLLAGVLSGPLHAQRIGTMAEWKARILDPSTLGVDTFPGATLNRKFTIDQIRLDESSATMAVYLISPEAMPAAADFYARQLRTTVETSGVGTAAELRVVRARDGDPHRRGLSVRVEHAQWATGKGQIWMRYDRPQRADSEPSPGAGN